MIALDDDAPTELRTDEDFQLTPLEEPGDEDESESGSQVIALDTEDSEEAVVGAGGMAAMLEEDLSAQPGDALGLGTLEGAPGMTPGALAEGAPLGEAAVLPEAPYSIWNVLSLALCAILLMLSGWFMYELMRNLQSWEGVGSASSSLMDFVLGLFEGKGK